MCAISLRLLYLTGLGTTRGHTSVRIPGTDTFFIKPWPHIQMHRARAEDLIVMDLEGNIVGAGERKITKVSEWPIHAEIYFTNVTSVPVEMTHTGVEPPLSVEARSLLFSIAHNALTNAYRHAEANRVTIDLEFDEKDSRLAVSDDGVGLPDDYAERGNGFTNMSRAAERLGGRLVVDRRGAMGGATVTCVLPREQ